MDALASMHPAEAAGDARNRVDIEEAYERHRHHVFRLALRYGAGRRAWAEDVTQEVFVRLMEVIERMQAPSDLGGWLYRVTANHCISRLRRERIFALATLGWSSGRESTQATPEIIASANRDLETAARVLEALPPKERVAFVMHHLDGKTLVEIGEILGHSKGYVSKLVAHAEARVRRALAS